MHFKRSLIAAISLFCLLAASSSALACACCSDKGQYDVFTGTPAQYQLELLKDMHLGTTPESYMTDGDDGTRGMGELGLEDLNLVDVYTNNIWKITIKSPNGKSGTLVLPRPAKMTTKKIDLHDKEEGDPSLYKEFAFDGIVSSGSGVFRGGIVRSTRYTLIFQGRGNNCDNAADFTHWRLEIKGAKAKYAFFGKMSV